MTRVYLAGPIFGCEDVEATNWRSCAKDLLVGVEVCDPMDRDYRGQEDLNVAEIVEEDKATIDTCDYLLVKFDKPSVGTSMEMLYAWERGKAVVVVSEGDRLSPWLRYHAKAIFRTLMEATTYIRDHGLVTSER